MALHDAKMVGKALAHVNVQTTARSVPCHAVVMACSYRSTYIKQSFSSLCHYLADMKSDENGNLNCDLSCMLGNKMKMGIYGVNLEHESICDLTLSPSQGFFLFRKVVQNIKSFWDAYIYLFIGKFLQDL